MLAKIKSINPEILERVAVYSLLVFWISLPFSSALQQIGCAVAIFSWLWAKISRKSFDLSIEKSVWLPFALYLGWVVLSFFWSEYPYQSFRGMNKVLKQGALFLMAADLFRNENRFKKWEMVFTVLFVVVTIDGWCQYLGGKDFLRGYAPQDSGAGPRVTASFKTYGLFACYLMMTIPVLMGFGTWYRSRTDKIKQWYFQLPFLLLSLPLLILTRSRGAMLAFAGAILIFLAYRKHFRLLIGAILILGAGVFMLPRSMVIHLDIEKKEQSIIERFFLWDRALNVIKAKPVTGTGINTYTAAHAKYDQRNNWRVRNYYAHNGYLQLAAEIGIPGLFFFLWFLISFFKSALKRAAQLPPAEAKPFWGFLVGIKSFLLFAATDTVLHNPQPAMTFWFMLGLTWAYLQRKPQ